MGLGKSAALLSRCALVWVAASAATALMLRWLLPSVAGGWDAAAFDTALVWWCSALAVAVSLWLWATAFVVALDAARGRVRRRRGVPVAVRRVVLAACGVALTSAAVTPAMAAPGAGPAEVRHSAGAEVLRGLRLPERIGVAPAAPHGWAATRAATPVQETREVLVRPGDTLWSLAAHQLGDAAGPEEIAAYWPRLYRRNVDVIGPDPDVIAPGQRLRLPRRTGVDEVQR